MATAGSIAAALADGGALPAMKRASRGSSAVSVSEESMHAPDGRLCRLCGEADGSQDPVTKKCRRWYYAPRAGRTQGHICWYCGRAWQSVYKTRFPKMSDFVDYCGQNNETLAEHKKHVEFLTGECTRAGKHEIRIAWSSAIASSVESKERLRQSVVVAEDEFVEYQYYVSQYRGGLGDPNLNGLGHRTGNFEGQYGVFVPGAPIKKIRTLKEAVVDKREVRRGGRATGLPHALMIGCAHKPPPIRTGMHIACLYVSLQHHISLAASVGRFQGAEAA